MFKFLAIAVLILGVLKPINSHGQSIDPNEFLPHTYGQSFTPHHLILDYFQEVASINPYVRMEEYGRSYELRPLIYAIITHPDNHKEIEEIRNNNLIRSGLLEGKPDANYNKAIVWLSLGVHGNEAGSTESAIEILHKLTNPKDTKIQEFLRNVVVILDPCLNPDGYSRYTSALIQKTGRKINAHQDDISHRESWPNGRGNHYLHDLNRDWVWATQLETRSRLKLYRTWLPHIHADFHELYPNNHSYFAPAAEPYNPHITSDQRKMEERIGFHNASYYDENNWLYFTKERFDLFYPGYGDTYPTFNGAIGMTYEQAGHGSSATSIQLKSGDTLSLNDRIKKHTTLAISTIEFAAKNAEELIQSFGQYYREAIENPVGEYRSYVLRQEGDIAKLRALLDIHDIKYGISKSDKVVSGFLYQEMSKGEFRVKKGDLVIPADQTQNRLVQVLFEPALLLPDSLTDDLTSWALPFAYGLKSVATKEKVSYSDYREENRTHEVNNAYAWIIQRNNSTTDKAVAALLNKGIKMMAATLPFTLEGQDYDRGTIVIPAASNTNINVLSILTLISEKHAIEIHNAKSGWTDQGPDLGSRKFRPVTKPEILIIGGRGISQYNYGQIWHFLDQDIEYPYTTTTTELVSGLDISRYTTIILPESYRFPDEAFRKKIADWVKSGGNLIAFGYAVNKLAESDIFGIKSKAETAQKPKPKPKNYDYHRFDTYGSSERSQLSNDIPGISILLKMDDTHPLGYRLGSNYVSLKTSASIFPVQAKAWNIGYTSDEVVFIGFVGHKVQNRLTNSCSFFVKDLGSGHITALIDNPLYRSFWQKGKQLFFNAVFLVP
jgi:hypothetical protein